MVPSTFSLSRSSSRPEGAEVAEQGGLDAVLFGQEGRNRQLDRADGVGLAAEDVAVLEVGVARADAGRLEAAEVVAALVEAVVDPDRVPAPAGDTSPPGR